MSFAIMGMGSAVPPTAVNQEHGKHVARRLCCRTPEQATWLESIYEHSGVRRRHLVLGPEVVADCVNGTAKSGSVFLPTGAPDDLGPTTAQRLEKYALHAGPLAACAAVEALGQSGLGAREITHLITVSCTGFHSPGVDLELIRNLGLSPATQRTHIGYMGCHGALNGLRVARALVEADEKARVLVCAVELCSLHYFYQWEPQKIVANALFADGAAAAVGAATAAAPKDAWQLIDSRSYVFPESVDDMTWTVSDHGFLMTLSRRVPGLIARQLRPWVIDWLAGRHLSIRDIGCWAIHPGGPKILEAVEESLGLSREMMGPSRDVLADNGNMSSPTILFVLESLRARRALRPCIALAFGPGLTVEAALLR